MSKSLGGSSHQLLPGFTQTGSCIFLSSVHPKQKEEVFCPQLGALTCCTSSTLRWEEKTGLCYMDIYQEAVDYLEAQHVPGEEELLRLFVKDAEISLLKFMHNGTVTNWPTLMFAHFVGACWSDRILCSHNLFAFLCVLQWKKKRTSWTRTFSRRRQCPVFSHLLTLRAWTSPTLQWVHISSTSSQMFPITHYTSYGFLFSLVGI